MAALIEKGKSLINGLAALGSLASYVGIGNNNTATQPVVEPSLTVTKVQDPIAVALKVALLYDAPSGTKLSFGVHSVDLSMPGLTQGTVRYWNEESSEDCVVLNTYLKKAVYLIKSFPEKERKRIFTHIILGLDALTTTYTKKHSIVTLFGQWRQELHEIYDMQPLSKSASANTNPKKKKKQPLTEPSDFVAIDKSLYYKKVKAIWIEQVTVLDQLLNGKEKDTDETPNSDSGTAAASTTDSKEDSKHNKSTTASKEKTSKKIIASEPNIEKLQNLGPIVAFLDAQKEKFKMALNESMAAYFGIPEDK